MDIPADIRVRSYHTLRNIRADYAKPLPMVRTTVVYWGPTQSGKSRRAELEAGPGYFPKSPRSKFWHGYQGEEHVVINEFRGEISIGHLLEWFDRYALHVELKGSSCPYNAKKIWITSNLPPSRWYKDIDSETFAALMRRLTVYYVDYSEEYPKPPDAILNEYNRLLCGG